MRIHITLRHPHIIELLAAFEDPEHVYLVQVGCWCRWPSGSSIGWQLEPVPRQHGHCLYSTWKNTCELPAHGEHTWCGVGKAGNSSGNRCVCTSSSKLGSMKVQAAASVVAACRNLLLVATFLRR